MKEIGAKKITESLGNAIRNSLENVDTRTLDKIKSAVKTETSELSKWAGDIIVKNAELASTRHALCCQDSGQAVIICHIGEDAHVTGLYDAINEGVRRGYANARKSVADPLTRLNTKDNTPCIIHTFIERGDKVKIEYLAKGAGSENMGKLYMLTPADGEQGIIDSAVDAVRRGGANACPPLTVGVGIGGTMEVACLNAKRALIEGGDNREDVRALESKILAAVNDLKIGMNGLGGDVTALDVFVRCSPTHIGMLPVAICLNCHSVRHCVLEF